MGKKSEGGCAITRLNEERKTPTHSKKSSASGSVNVRSVPRCNERPRGRSETDFVLEHQTGSDAWNCRYQRNPHQHPQSVLRCVHVNNEYVRCAAVVQCNATSYVAVCSSDYAMLLRLNMPTHHLHQSIQSFLPLTTSAFQPRYASCPVFALIPPSFRLHELPILHDKTPILTCLTSQDGVALQMALGAVSTIILKFCCPADVECARLSQICWDCV